MRKVEEWGRKGAKAIKRGCIDFLNRKGEKFDQDDKDMSELEMVSEQPKLVDPGVAEIPLSAAEKPSYVTRAVAARRRAGLDVESAPRQS